MASLDPFLDQEYEEDDDVLSMSGYGALPGTSASGMLPQQPHQYSSAPSSSSAYTSAPNYYAPPTPYEGIPTSSFYGSSQLQQQVAACTATMQPQALYHQQPGSYSLQPTSQSSQLYQTYAVPAFNSLQQHSGIYLSVPPTQQMHPQQQQYLRSVIVAPTSLQQQQYQFDQQQQELAQQQQLALLHQQQQQVPPPMQSAAAASSSSSDHSYASYNESIRLYDDGSNSRDGDNFSPVEKQTLRETPSKPVARTIQKKRSAIEKRVGETDSASAAAVRRISTEEGWKSMNGWLKAAEQDNSDKENSKLIQLLDQCRQAKVTVTLLRSNDTPKFIRKLSKNHNNDEVRALSLSIVTRWKKVVNTPDVVEEKKEKKVVKKEEEETAEEEDNHEMKNRSLETRRSSDEGAGGGGGGEKKKEAKKDKEHRVKAKVYHSKGRSAGLFETDDAANPAKKRSVSDTSPPSGAPAAKKSSTEKAPGSSTAPSSSTPPPKKPVAAQVKKVTTSSSFMDSLLSPAAAIPPKKKVLPKRPIPRPDSKLTRPGSAGGEDHDGPRGVIDMLLSPNADGKVVMEGLFADTSRSLKDDRVPTPPKAAVPVFVVEEPDMVVGRRKIRFADEQGGELVETRYFEVEEGERINVNRYTPEEMKHHEAMAEKKYMKDSSGMHVDDEDDENEDVNNPWLMPCQTAAAPANTPSTKWRFIPTDPDEERVEVAYGEKSQMRTIQEKRQMTAMMAFYNPNERCSHFDEPENLYDAEPEAADAGLRTQPIIIPTESVPYEEDEGIDGVAIDEPVPAAPALIPTSPTASAAAAQPAIAGHLQALLNGLKTKGLLHDGSAAPADDPLYSMPPPPVMMATAPQQQQQQQIPQPVIIPTTSTYYQEQAPGMGGMNGGFPPNRMHSIQQEFPGPMPPQPGMPPPMGASASSSGIQVVNMDVHGPGAPQTHVGAAAPFPPYHPGSGGRPFYVSNKPCNFFNSPRGCRFGDKCGFAHVIEPNVNGAPPGGPGGFRGGPRGGMRGDFRGGPPRGGAFRGRGAGPGFGAGPPPFGNNRDQSRGDVDLRRGGSWRDERRDRRRSRSRSLSPSRRGSHRSSDRDHRSSRRGEETKDVDLRYKDDQPSSRPAPAHEDDDIDGVPIESPVA